jgi:hypothetical protein
VRPHGITCTKLDVVTLAFCKLAVNTREQNLGSDMTGGLTSDDIQPIQCVGVDMLAKNYPFDAYNDMPPTRRTGVVTPSDSTGDG